MSDAVLCSVRERRRASGLSQGELAERAGVSRQALSAIEAGRQIPSTTLALQLARARGCVVDDLFQLPGGPVVRALLAASPRGTRRVVLGRVDGLWVAHPLRDESHAADGRLLGDPSEGDEVVVELFGALARLEQNVLVAGCAPLLGVLADRLGRRYRDVRATWIPANSSQALGLLERRLVHVAGLHLADAADAETHLRAARRALPGERATVVNLACWRQGLVVAAGNPLGVALGPELRRPELRFAVRDPGSGAQRRLERALQDAGAAFPQGAPLAADHAEVARMVRWGVADVGVAIESAALELGLGFVALSEERFDLVVPDARLDSPAVARFLDQIGRASFRTEAGDLPGYDLSRSGDVATVAP